MNRPAAGASYQPQMMQTEVAENDSGTGALEEAFSACVGYQELANRDLVVLMRNARASSLVVKKARTLRIRQ
jgi:hypothetical protein